MLTCTAVPYLTEVLQMNSDLVHASRLRPADHHRAAAVVVESAELRQTLLALGRHLAHADLVADHLDRLLTRDWLTEETYGGGTCYTSVGSLHVIGPLMKHTGRDRLHLIRLLTRDWFTEKNHGEGQVTPKSAPYTR